MLTRILRTSLLLLVVMGCGSGDLPTQPTTPNVTPTTPPLPPFEPSIEGEYRLTFTASPSCSLPAEAKQRTYTAKVAEPTRGAVTVTLSGAVFRWGLYSFEPGFDGTRDGDALRFVISNRNGRGVAELIDGTKELYYDGAANATVADRNITGTFMGQIYINVAGNLFDWLGDCTAPDHRIEFAR
jgi:hypothetical protein